MNYIEMKEKCVIVRTILMIIGMIVGLSNGGMFGILLIFGSVMLISFTANETCPICDYVRDNTDYLTDSKNED